MSRVVLVHWHEAECRERAQRLAGMGHEVTPFWDHAGGSALTRHLRAEPPEAVVIDLGRLPSHGRAVAIWLRERKALRATPLVFVPGDPAKTARLRADLPDATYAPWRRLRIALAKAIATPPKEPVVPAAKSYSGTPLPQKLGLKAGGVLAAVRAPAQFAAALGELPEGARTTARLGGEVQVVVLFCRALAELRADWPRALRCLADGGSLWVAWPKKSSGRLSELDESIVRAFGLDQGLVDTKVCAIDAVFSGLRFSRRRHVAR